MPNWYKKSKDTAGIRENYIRLFVVESPSPLDALAGIAEGPAVASIARLIGHQAVEYQVRSRSDFRDLCRYLGSSDRVEDENPERTSCMHVSAHGSDDGLLLGGDDVAWDLLAEDIQPFLRTPKNGDACRILVLSACMAESQKITAVIAKRVRNQADVVPPRYLFCTSGAVPWDAAAVAWAVFYHLLPQANLENKQSVQDILNKIASIGLPKFVYFRWDQKQDKYLRFVAVEK